MKKSKILLSLFIVTGFLISCNVKKREVEKMQLYAVKYPPEFKILANTLAPCFTGQAKSDTVIKVVNQQLPGDTITNEVTRHDTVFATRTITKPGAIQTRTVTIIDTVQNDREIGALQATLGSVQSSLVLAQDSVSKAVIKQKTAESASTKWLLWFLGACTVITVFVSVKVYSFFAGGEVSGIVKRIV